MKEDFRALEHQHELTLKSRSEMERQHEIVVRDLRDRHVQEIDRLERRCKHDELRSQNVIDGLESRLQQLQNDQINWHADSKSLQAQLANEKLAHQETLHRMSTTKFVMPQSNCVSFVQPSPVQTIEKEETKQIYAKNEVSQADLSTANKDSERA